MEQIRAREKADPRLESEPAALVTYEYDRETGGPSPLYAQVFGPRVDGKRPIVYESQIGYIQMPAGMEPTVAGNWAENEAREVLGSATGQSFAPKHPSANGADFEPNEEPMKENEIEMMRINLLPKERDFEVE